jgi:hypothetical protein
VQGVCSLVESSEFINQVKSWKTIVAEKCTELRESNTWKYFKVATRSVRKRLLEDLSLQEKFRRVSSFDIIKGETKWSHFARIKSRRRNLSLFHRSYQGATSSRNSLWIILEITRTVGSRKVAAWLVENNIFSLGSRINMGHWSCFTQDVRSFWHFRSRGMEETMPWERKS